MYDKALEQSLVDFGLALATAEDETFGAKAGEEHWLRKKATDWFVSNSAIVRSALCSQGKPRPAVRVATTIGIAAAIKLSGHFDEHFPAQSAATAIVVFGLEKFCAGASPE